ncbi:tail protein X [Pseudoalteromonas denitrificans]
MLQANPELSELPPIFSAGTLIELPTLTQATKIKTTVKLWG